MPHNHLYNISKGIFTEIKKPITKYPSSLVFMSLNTTFDIKVTLKTTLDDYQRRQTCTLKLLFFSIERKQAQKSFVLFWTQIYDTFTYMDDLGMFLSGGIGRTNLKWNYLLGLVAYMNLTNPIIYRRIFILLFTK